jgi:ankyrin repeat protein
MRVQQKSTFGPIAAAAGAFVLVFSFASLDLSANSFDTLSQRNPVLEAAKTGDVATVQLWSQKNKDLLTRADALGRTPLHFAARLGYTDVISVLIDASVPLDEIDTHGYTPLMRAVSAEHIDVVKLLLTAGADTSIVLPDGRSLIDLARLTQNAKLLDLVQRY